ncbi:hypothetical protein RMSM_03103 [Rhodopirellula maiorica SM1]|uniref:Uncharacterized protein n=1 Tax=Rhodopirellula maiorica SM1 TaxID=1265738 RepID=M5RKX9_9BACT|nr:hypothetical protein RMSM_03103 [Rhodopirellula maiorica SM1]
MSGEWEFIGNVTRRNLDTRNLGPAVTNEAEGQTDIALSIAKLDIARSIDACNPVP